MNELPKRKVMIGLSGGVDSSVSAALLIEQGYEVIGGFMKNWSDGSTDESCGWRAERRDAMAVAAKLGIPFHTFDFEEQYRAKVYEYMIAEYKAGRTPNPDVLCNKYMKFDLFMDEATKLGCEFVATGHYARTKIDDDGTVHLLAGVDQNKDQSYFLCQLTQAQLKKSMFPIGELEKPAVRELAKKYDLAVADKKDSQGICFVGQVDMDDFLKARIEPHTGNIVTTKNEVIGQHQGFEFYTIGQRGGLGIGGGIPYYVVERKPEINEVIVAVGEDDEALYRTKLRASNIAETIDGNLEKYFGRKIQARIRYRQPLAVGVLSEVRPGVIEAVFEQPQRAVAPGQFIAFYDDEELIGSAVIDN